MSLIKNPKICSIKLTYLLRIYHFFTFFYDNRKNFDSLSNFFAKSYPRQIIFRSDRTIFRTRKSRDDSTPFWSRSLGGSRCYHALKQARNPSIPRLELGRSLVCLFLLLSGMLSHAMPMLSPVLSPKKTHILNPCCSPSLPPRITGEKRGIFGGVSTLKWGQNGPAPEENETFFDKFWVNLSKKRTFDRLTWKFARSFMLDSWHTRLFEQEHMRNTLLIFKKFGALIPDVDAWTESDRATEQRMLVTRIGEWIKWEHERKTHCYRQSNERLKRSLLASFIAVDPLA